MAGTLGTIAGQMRIDVSQAVAAYASVRAANSATVFALRGASTAFAAVGVAALGAGAVLGGLFAKAVSSAAEFEKKIDFFGAVTNASQKDMQAVAAEALKMGTTTVFSAGQMADAFVEFGKAGISTKDALGGVAAAVVNLAQAADIGLTQASDIIISTLKTFRIQAAGASSVADLLAGAANSSIIEISDVGTSLKYVGGIAAATGVSLQSTVTAISLLGQAGIKGSTAGTSLRQILVSLNATSGKAKKQLQDLGIITKSGSNLFIDQKGHLKSLADVFQILHDHTTKLTDAQRLSALKIIFNNRALAAANILLKDGKKGFADMNAEITKVKAVDVARKRLDNLSGDLTRLKNTIQTTFIQAGTPFQAFARQVTQGITNIVKAFSSLTPFQQKLIFQFLGIGGAILIFVGTVALFASAVLKMIEVWRLFRDAMMLVKGVLLAVRSGFIQLTIAMLTNPFVLIALAVIALVALLVVLYKKNETVRNIIQAVGRAIVTAFQAVVGFFKGLPAIFSSVISKVVEIWNRIYAAIHGPISTVVKYIQSAWALVYQNFIGPVLRIYATVFQIFTAIVKIVVDVISKIVTFVAAHWQLILILITGPLGLIIAFVVRYFAFFQAAFRIGFAVISAIVRVAWAAISLAFTVAFTVISTIVKVALFIIISVIRVAWAIITVIFKIGAALLLVIFYGLFLALKAIVVPALNFIRAFISSEWAGIKAVFQFAKNVIVPIIASMFNAIRAVVSSVMGVLRSVISAGWNAIRTYIINPINAAKNAVVNAFNSMINTVTPILNRIASAVQTAMNAVLRIFQGIKDKIIAPFAGAVSWLLNVGQDIVNGLISGIASMGSAVVDALLSLIPGPLKKFAHKLGIASPSKVFFAFGVNIVEGLNLGIKRTQINTTAFLNRIEKFIAAARKAAAQGVGGASSLASQVNKENNALLATIRKRNSVANQLKAANAKLAAEQAAFNNTKTKVRDAILGSFDITNQGADSITGLLGNLQDQLTTANNFARNIANLAKKGVNKNILDQLAQAGPNAQTDASINALTQGSAAQIAQFNKLYASLGTTANGVGTQIATTLYGAGIRAAQGLVNGLKSQERALDAQMRRLAGIIVNTIKKGLKIHSPSQVFHDLGVNTLQGFINGVGRQMPKLADTMDNVSKLAMIDQMNNARLRAGTIAGTTVINNYNISKSATVNNPPTATTEQQLLDSMRKVDILAGGVTQYG